MVQYFPVVTGSLTVTGSVNISGGITASGGISISGSIASASYAASASNALAAQTASYVLNAQSASNAVVAQTASYANALTVAGTLTAQTLVVQTITSSVDFVTGSTRFGSTGSNTHVFTGSMSVNGSGTFAGNISLEAASGFPSVGLLNRSSDSNLYIVAASSGFLLLDNSQNTMYQATPTAHNWNISNSPKMTLNLSGSVGIGTTSPSTLLHINGSSATLTIADNTSYAAGVGGKLSLHGNYRSVGDITEGGYIKISKTNSTNGDYGFDMIFATSNYTAGVAERLRISSTGVATFSSSIAATQFTSQGGRGTSYGYKFPDWQIYNTTSGNALAFTNYTTDLLTISSTGGVGIGTTSPGAILHINGGAQDFEIQMQNGNGSAFFQLRNGATGFRPANNIGIVNAITSGSVALQAAANGDIRFGVSTSEYMRITSGGQVGIRITPNASWGSAMAALQIGTGGVLSNWTGANSNFTVGVNYYDNGAGSQLRLYTGATSNIGFNEDTITFNSAASSTAGSTITFVERMRISGGNVRIVNVGSQLQFDTDGSGGSTTLGTSGLYDFRIYNGRGGASNIDVSTYSIIFGTNGSTSRYAMESGRLIPLADNSYTMGASGYRWSAIWSANGTIQTSDARQKKDITPTNLGLNFIMALNPVSYKWKVGKNIVTSDGERIDENGATQSNDIITPVEGTRTHYGLIAQEVKEALGDIDFGGYVHDEETDTLALRYDQFISPLIKAIQELKAEFDEYKATHP